MSQAARPLAANLTDSERAELARRRAAHVRRRLRLATDALAAADLLLGLNLSLRSMARDEPK